MSSTLCPHIATQSRVQFRFRQLLILGDCSSLSTSKGLNLNCTSDWVAPLHEWTTMDRVVGTCLLMSSTLCPHIATQSGVQFRFRQMLILGESSSRSINRGLNLNCNPDWDAPLYEWTTMDRVVDLMLADERYILPTYSNPVRSTIQIQADAHTR